MRTYSLAHLSDSTLLRDLATIVSRDRATTAELLAHLGEVDARKLYLPAAYPSMYAYCMGELRMSEDSAFKRIRAARTAHQFPAIFAAVAAGRLHLSAVVLLAPCLTPENVEELVAAATHKSKSEIEHLLAARFPQPELPTRVERLTPAPGDFRQLAPGPVATIQAGPVEPSAPVASLPRTRVTPLAPERYALTIDQSTHDKLRYAQALLGHQIPASDVAAVLHRALDALIHRLERRKFAATAKPRRGHRCSPAPGRHVPAEVRRAVWERDGGQCTFVSETGRRCEARTPLEFDHVREVARVGEASLSGMRLRCRAHNQYGAECTFGAEFMRHKRLAAAEARATVKARTRERAAVAAETREQAAARAQTVAPEPDPELDVVPWLRQLGFRPDEACRAAEFCETLPNVSLEARVRAALAFLVRPQRRTTNHAGSTASPIRTG